MRAFSSATLVVLTLLASMPAHALSTIGVDACLERKLKATGKGAAAHLRCQVKAAKKTTPVDPLCTTKADVAMTTAFAKLDANESCETTGDGGARSDDANAFASSVGAVVSYAGPCDARKIDAVRTYVKARLFCYARAAHGTGAVDPECLATAAGKLALKIAKAEVRPECTHTGQTDDLATAADFFADQQACALDVGNGECALRTPTPARTVTPVSTPTVTLTPLGLSTRTQSPTVTPATPVPTRTRTPTPIRTATPTRTRTPTPFTTPTPGVCGDGAASPDEFCDETAPSEEWAKCGPTFTCAACTCSCPTRLRLTPEVGDPATLLDVGWTGLGHAMPIGSNADVTYGLSCAASERPCGACDVSGPIANDAPGALRNQRCSGDVSVQCNSAPGGVAGCGGPLGTCEFHVAPPLGLSTGGVGTCLVHRLDGGALGAVNVETGDVTIASDVVWQVYVGLSADQPCPICEGDATENDGVPAGTCSGGARDGLGCDANGSVLDRPDFGATSFECPPASVALVGSANIVVESTTGLVSMAVTSASPNCTGTVGPKCACDTCNNAAAHPCASNADCPPSGGNPGVCGGRRCLGGMNNGGPCGGAGGGASACPGGNCGRPGEPTRFNGCIDDASGSAGFFCVDDPPVGDHRGACPMAPDTATCSIASGHAQRGCSTANDCCDDPPFCAADPPVSGDCVIGPRLCFLDNGLDGSIDAEGAPAAPAGDVSAPTLASVFCLAPTTVPAANAAAGLPGPGRLTVKVTAIAEP